MAKEKKRTKGATRKKAKDSDAISDAKFKALMNKILEEDRDVLERLAKK